MTCADLTLVQLARRCFESPNNDLWEELILRLQPVFARAAYRVAAIWGSANVHEVDDIVQEICLKLVSRRRDIQQLPASGDEAVMAYFKTMAANCAHDYLRSRYARKRGCAQTDEIESRLDELASQVGMKQIEQRILVAQVETALDAGSRDRSIFWLYYRQGFTAKEIAASIGHELSDKGVESLIHRLTSAVRGFFQRQTQKGEAGGIPS